MADLTRNAELAAIHTAKRQLGLDDATYRARVAIVSGRFRRDPVDSAGMMTERERRALIDDLRSLGFRRIAHERPAPPSAPQASKIRALWNDLVAAGAIDATDHVKALRAFCKRQTGVESPDWLQASQASTIIEALKSWLARFTASHSGKEVRDGD